MKRGRMVAGVVACLWAAGCAGPSRNTVYQTSTIDALASKTAASLTFSRSCA